jgi:UDPglucose--hexose-1-phosphate uridylyltransferase
MSAGGRIRADSLRATESLYGPNRSRRPSDMRGAGVVCPFCPGNEHLTGALLTADPGPDWTSRVIANIYPAVIEPDGRHEVIVEMRAHDTHWGRLDRAEIERILRVYRERERAAYADGYAFAAMFKNSGSAAGASLRHPHAQVVALRTLPRSIAVRLERLSEACGTCAVVRGDGGRCVLRTAELVAYVPDGSRTAFEVRVAPVEHGSRFSRSADALLPALAQTVSGVMKRLAATLGEEVPFNVVVQSAPRDPRAEALVHWELEIIPRVENFGGFEIGTGGFMVSRIPEDAAGILRAAEVALHA